MAVIPGGLAGAAQGMRPQNWGTIMTQRRNREEQARQYDNQNKLAALKSMMGSTPPRIYFKQNPGAWKAYVEASGFGAGEAQKMWDNIMSDDSPATFDELQYAGKYSQIGPDNKQVQEAPPPRPDDTVPIPGANVVEASQTTTSTESESEPSTPSETITPPSISVETVTEGETEKPRTAIMGTGGRETTGYDFEAMTGALLGPDAWDDDTITNEVIVQALERNAATPLGANDRKILADYINSVRSGLRETGEASEAILQYPDIKRVLDSFSVTTGEGENIDRPTGSSEPTTAPPKVTRNEENIVDYFTPLVRQKARTYESQGLSIEAARKKALNEVIGPSATIDRNGEYTIKLPDGTEKVLSGNEAYGLRHGLYHNLFEDREDGGLETQPWWSSDWTYEGQHSVQPGKTDVVPTEEPTRRNVGGTGSRPDETRLSRGSTTELSSTPGGRQSEFAPSERNLLGRAGSFEKKPEVAPKKFEATEKKFIERTEELETLPKDAKPAEIKRAVERYSDAAKDYVSLSELTRSDDGRKGLMENEVGRESLRSAFEDTYNRPGYWAALASENAQYLPQYQIALQRQAQVNGNIQLDPVTDAQLKIEQAKLKRAEAEAKEAGYDVMLKAAELDDIARKTNNDVALAAAQVDHYKARTAEVKARIAAAKAEGNTKEEASLTEKIKNADLLLEEANRLHGENDFEKAAELYTKAYALLGADITVTPRNLNWIQRLFGAKPYETSSGAQARIDELNSSVDAAKGDDAVEFILQNMPD